MKENEKNGGGVLPISSEEWDFISFCDQFWRENGCFPSDPEIKAELGITYGDIGQFLETEAVKKHLTARGIDVTRTEPVAVSQTGEKRKGRARRLSDIQLAVVSVVLNPADPRSITKKLEALGVSPVTYNGWKKNKVFMDYMQSQGEMLFSENMPEVHNSLTTRAAQGDVRATKLLYEVSGRYRGNQQSDQGDIKMLLIALIEILQKHVSDPVVLKAIADDIQAMQMNNQAGLQNGNGSLVSGSALVGRVEVGT